MKDKYFIIGSNSFIAKKIIKNLASENLTIVSISRKHSAINQNKKIVQIESRFEPEEILNVIKPHILKNIRPIFIFCNSIIQSSILTNTEEDFLNKIFNINFLIPSLIIKRIIANYYSHKPAFFYFGSTRSQIPGKGYSFYGSSKAAMSNLFANLSHEYGQIDILFKYISLGIAKNGLSKNLSEKDKKNLFFDRSINKKYIDLKKLSKTILYESNHFENNGKIIYFDNGLT